MSPNPSTPPQRNYSLFAIPATYLLAFPPYLYQFSVQMISSGYRATNVLPRTNLELLKDKVSLATWQSLIRARGAHLNALEGFPLFAGAMLAGNYANLPARDLNLAAAEYIGARIIYTALYMTVKSEAVSYLRTGVYAWGLAAPLWVLWKAGWKVQDGKLDGDKEGRKL